MVKNHNIEYDTYILRYILYFLSDHDDACVRIYSLYSLGVWCGGDGDAWGLGRAGPGWGGGRVRLQEVQSSNDVQVRIRCMP